MKPIIAGITTILVGLTSIPAFAHHSMSAEFDTWKTAAITGTICSAELSNPHSYIYVHVKLANGQSETWKLELPGAARMTSQGVAKETFKAGDAITIQAYPSKTPAAGNATQSAIYSACTASPANALRVGHVRKAALSSGKHLTVSDVWPETVTVRQ